jgi:iron complex outermembrane receptor protein
MSATTRIAIKSLALSASSLALIHTAPAMAQVEEIIVTSQKVEENVQDVPIAITAISGDRLQQAVVFSLENISTVVPSVTFRKGTTSANSAIVMRGVGTISFSVAAEPSVSTVVDGVVLSRSGQAFMDLVDIQRLEVLRGPQGTLFGRNASAGLVNIVSKGGTDNLEVEANADWFEGDEYRLRAAISGPLAENVSARLTGFYGTFDGNITNINGGRNNTVNGYERYGVRGLIDFDNGPAKVRLIADYYKADDDCCADVTGVSRGNAAQDAELGLPGGPAQGENQRFINHNFVTRTEDEQWSLTATGDFEISDSHTLSAVLGYRNWFNRELREGDFLPRPLTTAGELHDDGVVRTEQLSAEIRIASDQSKRFFYQAGVFAWQSENAQDFTRNNVTCTTSTLPATPSGAIPCNLNDTVNTLFPTATSRSDVRSQNFAVFSQATYRFTDQLSLTGGLRYTWDDLEFTHVRAPGVNRTNGLPATGPGVVANPAGGLITTPGGNGTNTSAGSTTNSNLSGRAVIQYEPSEDVMLYGSYTRGYKGPAFNVFFNHTAPFNSQPIDEELSDSFEIGAKTQFLDNRVQLNVAAFSVKYDGFQANNFVVVNGATVSNLTNAGTVKSEGFEADLVVNPVDGLNLRASAAYADARVTEFNANPLTNAPDARNGTQLPLAPKFVYTLGGDYTRDLGDTAVLYLNTDYRHTSTQFSDLGEAGRIDPYGIWNASIGFSDMDDKYRLTFHVRNITDDSYVLLNVENGRRLQIPRDADRYFGISLRARM